MDGDGSATLSCPGSPNNLVVEGPLSAVNPLPQAVDTTTAAAGELVKLSAINTDTPVTTPAAADAAGELVELSAINTDTPVTTPAAADATTVATVSDKSARQRVWTTVLSAIVACIPFLLVGCTLGFPSGALLDLTDLEQREEFKLTREQADLFGALGYIGAVFGGPIAGLIADRMGRKLALMLVSIPYLIGYMMITYARFASDPVVFKVVLLIGRLFSGVGLGWSSLAVVVYVAEISSTKLRGRIGFTVQISLALGVVVIYGLSSIDNFLYYDQSLVLLGILALFVLIVPFLYESPRWLVANGFKEEATAALLFLRGPHFDSTAELNMILESIKNAPKLTTRLMVKEFSKGPVFVPVLLAVVLAMFLQCGGLNSVIAFSASILQSAEVPAFRQVALYGTGLTRLVVNILIIFFIDLFGRKVLLMISSIGTFLGTTLLGVHFYITSPSYCSAVNATNTSLILTEPCNPHLAPLAITGIVVYNVGFSIGWGPAIWLLLGELLPLRIRGVGNGIALFVMWGSASVVVGTYLSYSDAVQPWFVWWTYSIVNLASLFFVVFCLFETKGKSLEEIQAIFHTKYGNFRLGCK